MTLYTQVQHVEVDEDVAGQRLDNFLARLCKGVPKSHLYQIIRSGQLRVNGRRCSADYRLAIGDRLRVPPMQVTARRSPNDAGQERVRQARAALAARLPILYEDESIIVIDKPESIAVHGGSGVSSGVIERLRAARPEARFLELVHRIDRETSGVLVVAHRRAALLALQAQWRRRAPTKTYLAIVAGSWPLRSRTLSAPLRRLAAPDGDRRVVVDPSGQEAITRVTGLLRFVLTAPSGGRDPVVLSLVEARIETGRTHQIRVHLADVGFPIAGDPKYGDFALNRRLGSAGHGRMFLHAAGLRLRHPQTQDLLDLRAPLPSSFRRLLDAGGASAGFIASVQRMPAEEGSS